MSYLGIESVSFVLTDSEDESKLTIDIEEKILREKRKKEKKQKKREKKKMMEKKNKDRYVNVIEQQEIFIDAPSDQEIDQFDIQVSPSHSQYHPTSTQHSIPATPTTSHKTTDIRTVDLSQLGDLFSVPASDPSTSQVHTIISVHPQSSHSEPTQQSQDNKIFAKKSFPGPGKLPSKLLQMTRNFCR